MDVSGDLRTLSPEQQARAKKTMQAIVARHLPKTSAEITFDDGYPPMAPTPGNKRLLAMYDRASRDLGSARWWRWIRRGPARPTFPSWPESFP